MYEYNSLETQTSLRRDFREHWDSGLGHRNLLEYKLTAVVNFACHFVKIQEKRPF